VRRPRAKLMSVSDLADPRPSASARGPLTSPSGARAARGSFMGSCANQRISRVPLQPRSPARLGLAALALFAMLGGCSRDGSREEPVDPAHGSDRDPSELQTPPTPTVADWDAKLDPGPARKTSQREHPAGFAWVLDPELDEPRKLAIEQAEARGYTVI